MGDEIPIGRARPGAARRKRELRAWIHDLKARSPRLAGRLDRMNGREQSMVRRGVEAVRRAGTPETQITDEFLFACDPYPVERATNRLIALLKIHAKKGADPRLRAVCAARSEVVVLTNRVITIEIATLRGKPAEEIAPERRGVMDMISAIVLADMAAWNESIEDRC